MNPDYSKYSDEELFPKLGMDDHIAFTELYTRYKKPMFVHALKKIGHAEDAEDVLQDVFTRIWNNRKTLVVRDGCKAYLFTSLKNRILDYMLRDEHQKKYLDSLGKFAYVENHTDHKVSGDLFLNSMEELIRKYPSNMQKIFKMRVVSNLKNDEIAHELGLSEKTVRNQFSLMLKEIRKKLISIRLFLFF